MDISVHARNQHDKYKKVLPEPRNHGLCYNNLIPAYQLTLSDTSASTSTPKLHKSHITMAASADKSTPYIPLAGGADDGWSKEDCATATCYCGAVQLEFVSLTLAMHLSAPMCHVSNYMNHSQPKARALSTRLSATAQTAAKSPHPCSRPTLPSTTNI